MFDLFTACGAVLKIMQLSNQMTNNRPSEKVYARCSLLSLGNIFIHVTKSDLSPLMKCLGTYNPHKLTHTHKDTNKNKPFFICLHCSHIKTAEWAEDSEEGITFLLCALLTHTVCEAHWWYRWLCLLCAVSVVNHIYVTPVVSGDPWTPPPPRTKYCRYSTDGQVY